MATIHDYARICKAVDDCMDCPLSESANPRRIPCCDYIPDYPAEASAIIDKWCAEHPQKTYLQDFLEKFPKAEKMGNGLPYISPCRLYGEVFKCTVRGCSGCWNAVMPDEADKEEA